MRVSILIPVYNGISSVISALDRVIQAPMPSGCEKEIVVVDDGSTDGRTDLIDRMKNDECFTLIQVHHSILTLSKGVALPVLLHASGDIVIVHDGDLEDGPPDYIETLQPILEGWADVVYGSRLLAWRVRNRPLGLANGSEAKAGPLSSS
jgi:glycosyltransferase involved in cell wall biosynthesis